MRVLNPDRLAKVEMKGIVEHWTGGAYAASMLDKRSYHLLTEGTGQVVYGVDISLNSGSLKTGYAAHTKNANSNRIGHSMCGMAGAMENPLVVGSYPLTEAQWNRHVAAAADLCEFYKIPVAADKVLFHAEVQSTLGIQQNGKWDVIVLPWDLTYRGAKKVGDRFRDELLAALKGQVNLPSIEAVPASIVGGTAITTANSLNFRRGPGQNEEKTGSLPAGIKLLILGYQGDWLKVRTPMGHEGWVHGGYVKLLDTQAPQVSSLPDPIHTRFSNIITQLNELEALLPEKRDQADMLLNEFSLKLGKLIG